MSDFQIYARSMIMSLILALSLASPNLPMAQDKNQEIDRLKVQIQEENKLSMKEIDVLEPELRRHLQNKGHGDTVRALVHNSLQNGCKGTCLGEALRTLNRSMSKGLTHKEALEMVTGQMRQEMQERDRKQLKWSDQEFGERIRTKMEARLIERERLHERKMDRKDMKGMKHQKPQSSGGMKR
ncbi:MAG: hypothetical protein HYV97_02235 [Bdellovibrio sp.]|nr:hypothetical protein [Bdellovibrio sp.]